MVWIVIALVATYAAMKSGLKGYRLQLWFTDKAVVATYAAMKSGLKGKMHLANLPDLPV